MVASMTECAELLAERKEISKAEAMGIMDDVLQVISTKCVQKGGVSFKGLFTIKTKLRKGRTGKCHFNDTDTEYKTDDKIVLTITTGRALDEALNPKSLQAI